MADIPGIPGPDRKKPKRMRKVTTSKHWAEHGPLVPWMLNYLQWLAAEPNAHLAVKGAHKGYSGRGGVTISQKTAKASWFAKRGIDHKLVRTLEQRPDAIQYFEKLRTDFQFQARETMKQDIVTNIEARREGLDVARVEKDHKAIKGYTDWVTEVAFPKKTQGEDVKTRITINIAGSAAQKLIAQALNEPDDIQDVEWEEIPKQITEGDDDAA